MSRTLGGSLMALAALASVAVLAFAPGVGCGVNSKADIERQARERALGRHRIEAVSNYIQTQKKNAARIRNKKAKELAKQRAKTITPDQQAAFRAGAVIGAWNRYIAAPYKGTDGKLSETQAKVARLSLKGLEPRSRDLAASAKAAGLNDLATTASAFAAGVPKLDPGLAKGKVDPKVYDSLRGLVIAMRREAKAANLTLFERVPADFLKTK